MPAVEDLSEDERLRYARISHAALTSDDPKIRKQAKQLIKSLNPKFQDPELAGDELRAQIEKDVVEPLRADIKKLTDGIAERAVNDQWEKDRSRIEATGIKFEDVKKVMVDKKIADPDTAAEFLRMQNTLATPTTTAIVPQELKPDVKKLVGNQTALRDYQKNRLRSAVDEVVRARTSGAPLQ